MEFKRTKQPELSLEMAPLIDVVFLLLLYFMLTSTFVTKSALEIKLPSAETSVSAKKSSLEVFLAKDGTITIENEAIELEQIKEYLKNQIASDPKSRVSLNADANASVEQMIAVFDEIRKAGIYDVNVATLSVKQQ